ncbi:MAG: hypothetical protein NZ888_05120 [Candidatus Nitrosocaldus sp.]|nr:hypothetical protein [Candidatus Nitrosocaldus sp.]MDW8000333.1 hypothetical protein [Candidatus Nitrosocaldus sp.]
MPIPTIFLIQMLGELEQRKKHSLASYLEGVYELIALDRNIAVEQVKSMGEDELIRAYKEITDRLNQSNIDRIMKFFQPRQDE